MRHLLIIIILCGWTGPVAAQTNTYDIPLSKPGAPGLLEIDVYNAAIEVEGSDDRHATLTIRDRRTGKDKRFGAPDFLYDVVETNNHITIVNREGSAPRIKGLTLELRVPRNFSVKLSTYFGPSLEVAGLHGELEVEGYFTDLVLKDLQQNVVASTREGKIEANFDRITESSIVFISNYKGNTEIRLPPTTKATLLMDNYFGTFDSDFQLGLDTNPASKDQRAGSKFIRRTVNGGGTEIKLINYFGDIFIREH
jgi:hypothetical protein